MRGTTIHTGRTMRGSAPEAALLSLLAIAFLLVAIAVMRPASADAAFGDSFGVAPINDGAGPSQEVPALPGEQSYFWAGTCNLAGAPATGVDMAPQGGIGTRPATIFAPSGVPTFLTSAPAPATPDQCIDWGGGAPYAFFPDVWTHVPAWRQPPATQSGSRADGSLTFRMRKVAGEIDGTVDNVYVDLPPGVVGNPGAVPKCTPEQFAVKPLGCQPETQVGVIRLFLVAAGAGGNNMGIGNDELMPVFNLEPREGNVAELGFGYASGENVATVRLVAKARTNGDFGVTTFAGQLPAALPLVGQSITIWGVPWASVNDLWRPTPTFRGTACSAQPNVSVNFELPPSGLSPACRVRYNPSWGEIEPFIALETDCNPTPVSRLAMDAYQRPGTLTSEDDPAIARYPQIEDESAAEGTDANPTTWETYRSQAPAVTGCEKLGFDPDIEFEPTTTAADSASGLGVDLAVPQNNTARDGGGLPLEPPAPGAPQPDVDDYVADATAYFKSDDGLATAHLKDSVVTLPEGLSVNPSGATGLEGCSDSGIGLRELGDPPLFNNGDPFNKDGGADGAECPDGSKIGTARVDTPLLDEPLTGDVVLGDPKSVDPQSGEMFRLFIVVRNEERGLLAKIYGTTVANGTIGEGGTGRLTATFKNNPELPFDNLRLDIKGGPRGMVATPPRCGTPAWTSSFTPWSSVGAPVPVPDVADGGSFDISANCAFGFAPRLTAGMDRRSAGGSGGSFSFDLTRNDGEQTIRGVTAHLPTGLLANVGEVPLCTSAQASQNACPAASRIGFVDAAAGAGTPFVLEKKGTAYLTEGYKGAPYGLLVSVPAEAGPFRGPLALTPITVRQAVHVDPKTVQGTVISDPLPQVWHGIPLRTRRITVVVDRPGFMRNPTDCSQKQIGATTTSGDGATSSATTPFKVSGCSAMPFRPTLALRLTGRKQITTGKHPGVRAQVTQQSSEAGIRRAEVRLPKSLALDPANAQALCEFEDGTKPDLENRCPKGSIVGRARGVSPLLKDPLVGDVYFVKNVRRSSTGNLIRTLPMIVVALRGEIAVNLYGESDAIKGKLVNTFNAVPDAPVSKFNLNINGGANGILAVTGTRRGNINLCRKPKSHVAETDMDGQNGKRRDFDVRMKTPCAKKSKARSGTAKKQSRRGRS
jgi:hypothetical protein